VHYYLAILYLSTSRDQEAIAHLKPAEGLLKNDSATAMMAITACLRSNAPAEALHLIDLVEQGSGFSGEQDFKLAELLNAQQMYAASAARLRRVVEMQPSSWQNQYNLAIALVRAKENAQALPLLASISAEHATDAKLQSSLASTYETAGETSLALEAYQKAIAADPANPDRYLDCTRLMMDLDRYDEAITLVEHGITMVSDDYPLTIRLGAIEMMRGNRDAAREHYRKAIAEHPAVALGYVALAQSFMKEGKDAEALKILTDGRVAVGTDFALEYVYGLVLFQLGEQKQAMEAFKSAETLSPAVVEPHYQLGLLYMKLQQWQDAQKEFEQVLKLDPQHAATYYQLSRTYQRLVESEKAQQMAKQASVLTKTQREDATKAQALRFGVPAQQ
jgi:tetratricopeptide (TPR) repeat protein